MDLMQDSLIVNHEELVDHALINLLQVLTPGQLLQFSRRLLQVSALGFGDVSITIRNGYADTLLVSESDKLTHYR